MRRQKVGLTFLLASLIIITSLIIDKKKPDSKWGFTALKTEVTSNMNFLKIATVYNGILGNIFPLPTTEEVSLTIDDYISVDRHLNGVIITSEQEVVKAIASGVVIFKGVKKDFGNVLIIKAENDLEYYYGYLVDTFVSLYSYVRKDDLIGIGKANEGVYLSYLEIIGQDILNES